MKKEKIFLIISAYSEEKRTVNTVTLVTNFQVSSRLDNIDSGSLFMEGSSR